MATNKRGMRSFQPPQAPVLTAWASVAGKKEAQGPLGSCFDYTDTDTHFGEKSWEKAECRMQSKALALLLQKAGRREREIDLIFSGDLLNQCISSSFALRNTKLPSLGLYGACSTMAESLLLAAMAVSGGFADRVVAMTSSHFASSERQYRNPLGYGAQRTPTAQWTVTGAGAVLVSSSGQGPCIDAATVGTIEDLGITDANNMGAAMAPAAFETIRTHFEDFHTGPEDFDLILTGDLGSLGHTILLDQFQKIGVTLQGKAADCGMLIYGGNQDTHAGGSGCGCSAAVLCGQILDQVQQGKLRRVLFCGTGALLSPTSSQQGESIPGVCHAVAIRSGGR